MSAQNGVRPPRCCERVAILLPAVVLDLALGDPPNGYHPVAWLGRATDRLERLAPQHGWAARLVYGLAMVQGLVGTSLLVGTLLERALAGCRPAARVVLTAGLLKLAFSFRDLIEAAARVRTHLKGGDLDAARADLRSLVSRAADELDAGQVASAVIESLAENLSDSLVAPLLYYLAFGLPGALGYRAANTLDAMIGYHGEYEELGKAAAHLDDLLNLGPARLSALLLLGAACLGFGDRRRAWSGLWRDHARTESPNAGWPMSVTAGALAVRLEKVGHYRLGEGQRVPVPDDIGRAVRLCAGAAGLGLGAVVLAAVWWSQRRRATG
jgi:adenosylcobinamide-phosphate synthase